MDKESLVNILTFIAVAFVPVIFPATLQADEWNALQAKEVVVLYQAPLLAAAQEVAMLYPDLKGDLEETFGWGVNFIPTVVLVNKSEDFQRTVGSNLIVAFAQSDRNQIVLDYTKMKAHPFSLETTLKHELCHLLLHNHIKRESLPRWLDEGICQWVSDGFAEIILDRKGAVLDEAVLSGRYLSIRGLTKRFPKEKHSLMLAYEESKSLLEYMISSYGKEGVLSVLNDLKKGANVDEAIQKGLSISLGNLEADWHQHLKRRTTWLTYLINHLYTILFFLGALTLVYGFIRQRIKKLAYQDEEEEDWRTLH